MTIKTLLAAGLDRQPALDFAPAPAAPVRWHARPWTDFFPGPGGEGGPSWN